jgi:3-hydroxyacyl-[acyl-carrier-protein] dehydratase
MFLDRVIELDPGVRGVGLKNVTYGDSHFVSHFPEQSIMPGGLLVEGCAQLAAIVLAAGQRNRLEGLAAQSPAPIGYLAAINRFKQTEVVVPGEAIRFEVQIGKRLGDLLQVNAVVWCRNNVVAGGEIVLYRGGVRR